MTSYGSLTPICRADTEWRVSTPISGYASLCPSLDDNMSIAFVQTSTSMVYVGSSKVTKAYVGSTEVDRIYVGSTRVF